MRNCQTSSERLFVSTTSENIPSNIFGLNQSPSLKGFGLDDSIDSVEMNDDYYKEGKHREMAIIASENGHSYTEQTTDQFQRVQQHLDEMLRSSENDFIENSDDFFGCPFTTDLNNHAHENTFSQQRSEMTSQEATVKKLEMKEMIAEQSLMVNAADSEEKKSDDENSQVEVLSKDANSNVEQMMQKYKQIYQKEQEPNIKVINTFSPEIQRKHYEDINQKSLAKYTQALKNAEAKFQPLHGKVYDKTSGKFVEGNTHDPQLENMKINQNLYLKQGSIFSRMDAEIDLLQLEEQRKKKFPKGSKVTLIQQESKNKDGFIELGKFFSASERSFSPCKLYPKRPVKSYSTRAGVQSAGKSFKQNPEDDADIEIISIEEIKNKENEAKEFFQEKLKRPLLALELSYLQNFGIEDEEKQKPSKKPEVIYIGDEKKDKKKSKPFSNYDKKSTKKAQQEVEEDLFDVVINKNQGDKKRRLIMKEIEQTKPKIQDFQDLKVPTLPISLPIKTIQSIKHTESKKEEIVVKPFKKREVKSISKEMKVVQARAILSQSSSNESQKKEYFTRSKATPKQDSKVTISSQEKQKIQAKSKTSSVSKQPTSSNQKSSTLKVTPPSTSLKKQTKKLQSKCPSSVSNFDEIEILISEDEKTSHRQATKDTPHIIIQDLEICDDETKHSVLCKHIGHDSEVDVSGSISRMDKEEVEQEEIVTIIEPIKVEYPQLYSDLLSLKNKMNEFKARKYEIENDIFSITSESSLETPRKQESNKGNSAQSSKVKDLKSQEQLDEERKKCQQETLIKFFGTSANSSPKKSSPLKRTYAESQKWHSGFKIKIPNYPIQNLQPQKQQLISKPSPIQQQPPYEIVIIDDSPLQPIREENISLQESSPLKIIDFCPYKDNVEYQINKTFLEEDQSIEIQKLESDILEKCKLKIESITDFKFRVNLKKKDIQFYFKCLIIGKDHNQLNSSIGVRPKGQRIEQHLLDKNWKYDLLLQFDFDAKKCEVILVDNCKYDNDYIKRRQSRGSQSNSKEQPQPFTTQKEQNFSIQIYNPKSEMISIRSQHQISNDSNGVTNVQKPRLLGY